MNGSTRNELLATPVGDLAALPATALYHLTEEVRQELAAHRQLAEHLNRALELRYLSQAQAALAANGRKAGAVHFQDGPVRVTADLPQLVTWDQARLTELAQRIAADGEDSADYLEISYAINEAKFQAWAEPFRQTFATARITQPGQPGFHLSLIAN